MKPGRGKALTKVRGLAQNKAQTHWNHLGFSFWCLGLCAGEGTCWCVNLPVSVPLGPSCVQLGGLWAICLPWGDVCPGEGWVPTLGHLDQQLSQWPAHVLPAHQDGEWLGLGQRSMVSMEAWWHKPMVPAQGDGDSRIMSSDLALVTSETLLQKEKRRKLWSDWERDFGKDSCDT